MNKIYIALLLCLLLIPSNALDILIETIKGQPFKQPIDVVANSAAPELNTLEKSSQPEQILEPIKPFREDPNKNPIDPKDLPVITDRNEPKEVNPTLVPIDPKDIPVIVDKNEPKKENPSQVPINPNDFFTIVDKNEPKEVNPVPVDMPVQELPPKPSISEPKPELLTPKPPVPRLAPQLLNDNPPKTVTLVEVQKDSDNILQLPERKIVKDKSLYLPQEPPPPTMAVPQPEIPTAEKPANPGRPPAVDPDAYEPDNSATQYTNLTMSWLQNNQSHTMHASGDQDWYRFKGSVNENYRFWSSGSTDVVAYLYQEDGVTLIASNDDGAGYPNFLLEFSPYSNENYKLMVIGYGSTTGAYTFNFLYTASADVYEPDDSALDCSDLNIYSTDLSQSHTLHSSSDTDWYQFYGISGLPYTFFSTGSTDTRIWVFLADGTTLVAYNDDGAGYPNYLLTFTPSNYALYKIKVDGYNGFIGAYAFHYFYSVSLDSYEPDNYDFQYTNLYPLDTPTTQDHTIHPIDDQDWYRFYAFTGTDYTFYSSYTTDTYASLYTDDGMTLLASDDDSGVDYNFRLVFTPPADGYYKIQVIALGGYDGFYQFTNFYTVPWDFYEPDNSSTQFGIIYPDPYSHQSQDHTIHNSYDEDWYRFNAVSGRRYFFYSIGNANPAAYLYESDGVTLINWNDDYVGYNFVLQFTPSVSGDYYLKVDGVFTSTLGSSYTLKYYYVVEQDSYEPDNGPYEYTDLGVTGVPTLQSHTLHINGDEDWFRLYGYTGRIYSFSSTGGTDTQIYIYQDDGSTLIAWDEDSGEGYNFALEMTFGTNDTYRIMITSTTGSIGAYDFTYFYRQDPDGFEVDDSSTQARLIYVYGGGTVSEYHSLHNATDEDWYYFYAEASGTYRFWSEGNTDTQAYLYASDGTTLIMYDDDGNSYVNFLIEHTPTSSGYFYIKVSGYVGSIGAYIFNYTYSPPPDIYEPDNSPSQVTYIDPSSILQTQKHSLHATGDEDWFRFYGLVGSIYTFSSFTESFTDPQIYLYEDDGSTQLGWDDDGGVDLNFSLDFSPTVNAFYKIMVSGWNWGFYDFNYEIWANPDAYEPDDSAGQYTSISCHNFNQTQNHTLDDATDEDWYRFQGVEGRIYHFESTGNIDTQIIIYDNTGAIQLDADDDDGIGNNFLLDFVPSANAYYKIKVVAFPGWAGAYIFNYYFWVPEDAYEPDNSATVYTTLSISSTLQTQNHTFHEQFDEDWCRFYGTAGLIYTLSSTGNLDTSVFLYQDNGTTLLDQDYDDGEGNNFLLEFAPSTTAWYKFRVILSGGQIGPYLLNYICGAAPDTYEPDNNIAQFTPLSMLSINQTQYHTLHNATDEDWYRFYAFTDRIYTFYSTGNTDTQIYLFTDSGSTQLDWDDDDGEGNNFFLQFTPPTSDFYKLFVVGYIGAVGLYTFNYIYGANPDAYEPDDSTTLFTMLTVTGTNQTQNHTLHNSTDQDWFRFQGLAGRNYRFYSTGNTDTKVWLYQDDGITLITSNDDGGGYPNFLLEYTPTTTANYKLKVDGVTGSAGSYVINYSYSVITLTPPVNLHITRSGGSVTLTWDPVVGATGYKIEASSDPYTGFIYLDTTILPTWSTTAGAGYKFFRVIATN